MLQTLSSINLQIFSTANQQKKSYKHYAEQLTSLLTLYQKQNPNISINNQTISNREINEVKQNFNEKKASQVKNSEIKNNENEDNIRDDFKIKELFAIGFYNISKISGRYKYLQTAMLFLQGHELKVIQVKWWLQMLALASSRDMHLEAYREACKLMEYLTTKINELKLPKQEQMLAREVTELVHRQKISNMISASSLNELQMNRKFETDCFYASKSFHIADIMIMQPINPQKGVNSSLLYPSSQLAQFPKIPKTNSQIFFHYLIYLSIACFTRATQRFYCRDSSDKDYHYKAIQIAGYLYNSKSTFMRFLRRTYKEHYLERLELIEEVCQFGERKVRVLDDGDEIGMTKMPWDGQQIEN